MRLVPTFQIVPDDDWKALLARRTNVLVTGADDALEAFLAAAIPVLAPPVERRAASHPPSANAGAGTLVLSDVDTLDAEDQRRLNDSLTQAAGSGVPVIACAATPIYALVEAGLFDPALYYRLAVIRFDVVDRRAPRRRG